MSRSKQKNPRFSIALVRRGQLKRWKRSAAKALRQATRRWLRGDPEESFSPEPREVADVWGSPSDGKRWDADVNEKEMRK